MSDALLAGLVMLTATGLSAVLVPAARGAARRVGIIDQPGERKIHAVPTPRTGGVAVFVSFTLVVGVGYALAPRLVAALGANLSPGSSFALLQESFRVQGRLVGLLTGGAVAFAVGLADDALGRRFPVLFKALGQLLAALILVAAGVRTTFLPYEWMNVVVTVVWIVGVTNAFNLLDNMDGLCAGVALIATGVFLITAWSLGEFFIVLILSAFAGSLLGLLFFNAHPATIFLGDNGSLFIGFMMGSLTLLERYLSHASSTIFPVLMPVLVLAVPLADTATVMAIRLRERRPIYVGDERHISHRLVALGFSQRGAVLLLYLMTLSLGLGATSLTDATPGQAIGIL